MSLARFVYCVGVNATAVVVAFVHLLFVALTPRTVCGSDIASDPWHAATATGVVLALLLALMGGTGSWLGRFRWPLTIEAALGVGAVFVLIPYLTGTTIGGFDLCAVHQGQASGVAGIAARLWVPFEFALILGICWRAVQATRLSRLSLASLS